MIRRLLCCLALMGCGAPQPAIAPVTSPPAAPPAEPPAAAKPPPVVLTPTREPKRDPRLDRAQRAAYRAALRDGRDAHRDRDYAAAVAAFDRAVEVFTDDPRALNERGWARYHGGDLAGAKRDLRASLARTVDPDLVGAGWYNLGRIHEDEGDAAKAEAAYRRSLAVRPHPAVRKRLAKYDAAVADPLVAKPLIGPLELDAVCPRLLQLSEPGASTCRLDPPVDGQPRTARTFVSIFADGTPAEDGPGTVMRHLLFPTEGGVFVLPNLLGEYNPGAFGIFEEAKIDSVEEIPLGDRRVWWIETQVDGHDSDMGLNEVELWSRRWVTLCGVGQSGGIGCVGPLLTKLDASREIFVEGEDPDPDTPHDLWTRAARFTFARLPSGALEIKAVGQPAKGVDASHVGVHRLVFP